MVQLEYAERFGFFVVPLRLGSKLPMTAHGFKDATRDPSVVRSTWALHPRANVGIACAASGLVVVDVDRRNGGPATMAVLEGELGSLPRTPTVLTGNGTHTYLRAPPGARFLGSLGAGIDLKHHGYVVAPPSVHPNGTAYEWAPGLSPGDVAIAAVPEAWLRRMLVPPPSPAPARGLPKTGPRYALGALARAVTAVEQAGEGARNVVLNREAWAIARFVVSGELPEPVVRRAFVDAARAAGLPAWEAERTVASALRRAS